MHDVVTIHGGTPQHRQSEESVKRELCERRADAHATHERRPQAAKHPQPWQRDVLSEGVGDEVHLMAESRERADPVVLAERRPARFEERLGRDHQDAHVSHDFRTKS